MTSPHKETNFEQAIEAHLLAHGWREGDHKTYNADRGLDPSELLAFIEETQEKALEKLISTRLGGDWDKARATIVSTVSKMLDSQGVLRCLRSGVTVLGIEFDLAYFRPEVGLTADLNARYDANRLAVVRQLAFSSKHTKTLDLALLVNGIPVATAELKNKLTSQTVEDAKRQYRTDRDPKELLFAKRAIAHFAVDTDEVYLTTRLAGQATRFLPFNRGTGGGAGNPPGSGGGYATSYLWEEVWERDSWLDLLRRFVHRQKDNGDVLTIFPRYHQLDAVRKLVGHSRAHGVGHNYLIEHSAGSGKSNTIAWLAHRLALIHDDQNRRVFDKVIVVTDRIVLDRQLGDTVYQFEHVAGLVEKAEKGSADLAAALSSRTARIVISTLQKFPFILDRLEELPEGKFAVIIDEAHSSQGGEAAKALRQALGSAARELEAASEAEGNEGGDESELPGDQVQDLVTASVKARGRQPNLSYFAFTATPTRRTLELFGSEIAGGARRAPFDLYSMRQAIEEGFIIDVLRHYTPYSVLWKVASNTNEDKKVEKGKATAAIVRQVSRDPKTLKGKTEVIVAHCHGVVAHRIGGKAKAMVVCPSREQAIRTYFAIKSVVKDRGYTDCEPLVAFSDSITIDGSDYTEAARTGFGEAELPTRFGWVPTGDAKQDAGKTPYRILVVAEKYQTGFDQPLLQTMYVDKKLGGVKAVQTLSRLNRIHAEKDDAFVLDFVNDTDTIRESFEDYFEATISEATDPAELYLAHGGIAAFDVIDEDAARAFSEVFLGGGDDPTAHGQLLTLLQPAVSRFEALDEEDQKAFRLALAKFVDIYAFMAQAIAFTDERLEAAFLYARHLQHALPSEHSGTLDLGGDIVLSHLRVEAGQESNVSPSTGGDMLPGETGDVQDPIEPAFESLEKIVEELNSAHGAELSAQDRVMLEQAIGDLAADQDLVQEAKVNSRENFLLAFEEPFEEEMMKTEGSRNSFFERFFSDESFRNDLMRGVGEEFHRRHGGGDQMAA